ncbi:hypothetical protein KUCAC02_029452, partial [Chaenocephalus aceratus]
VNYVLDETRPMEELIVKDCHTCLTRENLVTLGLRREMDSMVGTACLRLIHEAMQYQGKDVFVVDLHVPPTWLAPNHCDARLSLPVDSHKRDALISPCGSQGTLFCVHGRRCAHFTVEGQQTRTRIDSGSVTPLTRIPRKRRCDEVTMLPAETLLKIFVLVVLEDDVSATCKVVVNSDLDSVRCLEALREQVPDVPTHFDLCRMPPPRFLDIPSTSEVRPPHQDVVPAQDEESLSSDIPSPVRSPLAMDSTSPLHSPSSPPLAFARSTFDPEARIDVVFVDIEGVGEGAVAEGGHKRVLHSPHEADTGLLDLLTERTLQDHGPNVSGVPATGVGVAAFLVSRLFHQACGLPPTPARLDLVCDVGLEAKLQKIAEATTVEAAREAVGEALEELSLMGGMRFISDLSQREELLAAVLHHHCDGLFIEDTTPLEAEDIHRAFGVSSLSVEGSNRRRMEARTTGSWRDWLQTVEGGERPLGLGDSKLEKEDRSSRDDDFTGTSRTFKCNGMEGRYVTIVIRGRAEYLTLCEVEVTGQPPGPSNIAKGGKVTQSSIASRGYPARAIDGNRASVYNQGSCTQTRIQRNPWWRLDLQKTYRINTVTITNRKDCCSDRINGAQIRVGNSLKGRPNPM